MDNMENPKPIFFEFLLFHLSLHKANSFMNRKSRRINFSLDDFVFFASQNEEERCKGIKIGRIDGIFTHDLNGERRAFIVLTEFAKSLDEQGHIEIHRLLNLPYMESRESYYIVGVPALQPEGIYFINLRDDDRKVWVHWNVEFL
jgi:hypothetical protein